MTKFYLLLLAFALYLGGCKSAGKSYNKGDYREAIELGVKQLQKDPSDAHTLQIVQHAYNQVARDRETRIRSLSNTRDDNRFEKIYHEYNRLQDLYQALKGAPVAFQKIKPTDYTEYLDTYREKSADIYTQRAYEVMQEGTKPAFREAYQLYSRALRFRPSDRELKRRKDSAYEAALLKVVVVPLQGYGGYGGNWHPGSYLFQNFQNEVMRTLTNSVNADFVRFYTEWDARGQRIVPDQVMELALGRMIIGQPFDNRSSREVKKDVVVKETVFKPDSVVKQYATVTARITTTQRTMVSEGELFLSIRDREGRILWNDRLPGQHQWRTSFATYTGDERALSTGDKELINRTGNQNDQPREEQVLEEIFRQMQNELRFRLRDFYR